MKARNEMSDKEYVVWVLKKLGINQPSEIAIIDSIRWMESVRSTGLEESRVRIAFVDYVDASLEEVIKLHKL